jgi:ribosome-binding protein aMBF1 (putative translation factor)
MKKIIGFTDQITECECCGKTNLKGTYCLEIDGTELYYGSSCAFKAHGITQEEQRAELSKFKAIKKTKEKLKAMEQDYDTAPTYLKIWKMTNFAIANKKAIDIRAYFQKYGEKREDISNDEEEFFYITQTSQQVWINN